MDLYSKRKWRDCYEQANVANVLENAYKLSPTKLTFQAYFFLKAFWRLRFYLVE